MPTRTCTCVDRTSSIRLLDRASAVRYRSSCGLSACSDAVVRGSPRTPVRGLFALTFRLTHCDAVLWRGPILTADARARDRARRAAPDAGDSQCWPSGPGRLSDFGSRMGAARLGQAASDAVIVTLRRSPTCARTVTRVLWPLEHCVRIEGVRGSNPLSSTRNSRSKP